MQSEEAVKEQLAQRYVQWMEAIRQKDLATCEQILAEEYTYTASGQGRYSRQGWLDAVFRYDLEQFDFRDIDVRHYGDLAVCIVHYQQEASFNGAARSGAFLITDVWVKRDGRWQVVARSSILHSPA